MRWAQWWWDGWYRMVERAEILGLVHFGQPCMRWLVPMPHWLSELDWEQESACCWVGCVGGCWMVQVAEGASGLVIHYLDSVLRLGALKMMGLPCFGASEFATWGRAFPCCSCWCILHCWLPPTKGRIVGQRTFIRVAAWPYVFAVWCMLVKVYPFLWLASLRCFVPWASGTV